MQKLCPFYKFERDFANKVEIHIYKFSQQVDHISRGQTSLTSNGAPHTRCAITNLAQKFQRMHHPPVGRLSVFKKTKKNGGNVKKIKKNKVPM